METVKLKYKLIIVNNEYPVIKDHDWKILDRLWFPVVLSAKTTKVVSGREYYEEYHEGTDK